MDPANNPALAEIEGKTGPSNFYRVMANKPDVLASFPRLYSAIMGPGSLDRRLKEMVYLAVSFVNECEYCTEAHLRGGRKAGLSERVIDDLENETNQNFTLAEQAALHYAREMTRACAEDFDTREHLQEHFNEEQIVELTLVIAMANFTNRFNNGLNTQVEHERTLSTPAV
ncbi:MAG TPA: carboxymuconolactone decarboxylase family protein [Bryobacteraceae bacterium]|nr:carboxymuconolactone decarboxylase family protein [Bryobacteraceae bacterium]